MDEYDLEKAILKKVYVWMVVGGMAVGAVGGSGVIRYDKFGYSDFERESNIREERILLLIEKNKLECDNKIAQSEARKPPGLTRQRISATENCCRRVDPEYKQPTWEWH